MIQKLETFLIHSSRTKIFSREAKWWSRTISEKPFPEKSNNLSKKLKISLGHYSNGAGNQRYLKIRLPLLLLKNSQSRDRCVIDSYGIQRWVSRNTSNNSENPIMEIKTTTKKHSLRGLKAVALRHHYHFFCSQINLIKLTFVKKEQVRV